MLPTAQLDHHRCPVCRWSFESRVPRKLNCGHAFYFCENCLKDRQSVRCCVCHHTTPIKPSNNNNNNTYRNSKHEMNRFESKIENNINLGLNKKQTYETLEEKYKFLENENKELKLKLNENNQNHEIMIEKIKNDFESKMKDVKTHSIENSIRELEIKINNTDDDDDDDDSNKLSLIIEIKQVNNNIMSKLNRFLNNNETNVINNFECKWFEWDINNTILWFKYNLTINNYNNNNNKSGMRILEDNYNGDNNDYKIDGLSDDDDCEIGSSQIENILENSNFYKMEKRMKQFGFIPKINLPLMAQEYRLFEQICGINNENQCKLLCKKTKALLERYPDPK